MKKDLIATVAYILDRAEQYDKSSGYVAAFTELAVAIANDAHVHAWRAGELDDLWKRASRFRRRTVPSTDTKGETGGAR